MKMLVTLGCLFGVILQLHAQGYLVPNGVAYSGYSGLLGGYEIDVAHDPTNLYYTGFSLNPVGKSPPSTAYTNTFRYDHYVDVGVRVFLVAPNGPISLQSILSQSFTELRFSQRAGYVFEDGNPFFLAFYTGNMTYAPPDGIYTDPLFGWAELVNNQGVIQLLDSALEYQGGGIYAGTQTIIPVPEPSAFALVVLSAACLGWHRRRDFTN